MDCAFPPSAIWKTCPKQNAMASPRVAKLRALSRLSKMDVFAQSRVHLLTMFTHALESVVVDSHHCSSFGLSSLCHLCWRLYLFVRGRDFRYRLAEKDTTLMANQGSMAFRVD
jgi:hypothetical protein